MWFAGLIFVLGIYSTSILQAERTDRLVYALNAHAEAIADLSARVDDMQTKISSCAILPQVTSTPMVVPITNDGGITSPSGKLLRGSMSSDGKKFAGYQIANSAKRGVAVELLDTKQTKYIVLFSPSQSTGSNSTYETSMSVRWKDAKTVEYDVLETVGGKQVKKTETVTIGF